VTYISEQYHRENVLDWDEIVSNWQTILRRAIRKGNTAEIADAAERISWAAQHLKKHADTLNTTNGATA
jgi:hypothetical protein